MGGVSFYLCPPPSPQERRGFTREELIDSKIIYSNPGAPVASPIAARRALLALNDINRFIFIGSTGKSWIVVIVWTRFHPREIPHSDVMAGSVSKALHREGGHTCPTWQHC